MPLQIEILDDDVRYFNAKAKQELVAAIRQHADEVVREVNRLESVLRTTSGDPEITSSMVKDASIFISRRYTRIRKSWTMILAQLLLPILSIITGILLNIVTQPQPQIWVIFALLIAAFITTSVTFYTVTKE